MSNSEAELARYHKRIAKMIDYLGGQCVRCGSTLDLQFDHVDPSTKSFTIARGWSYAWDTVKTELAKCQLLCHTCHSVKTNDDLNQGTPHREHGTWGMYRREKCRCDVCREFYNAYRREWRKQSGVR